MLKVITIVSIISVLIVAGLFTCLQFNYSSNINYIEIGTLIILALTLVAIIFYVADTHTIAKASEATYKEIVLKQRKTENKFIIWCALEQTNSTPPSSRVEELSNETGIDTKQIEELLFEMLEEGIIFEGPFPRTFTRYAKKLLSD